MRNRLDSTAPRRASTAPARSFAMKHGAPLALTFAVLAGTAAAQTFAPPFHSVPQKQDTGFVALAGSGASREVVHQFTVVQNGAEWLRLWFDDVVLAGDVLAGNGAQLRLTAHFDGAIQLLDAVTLEQWGRSSAYFNGDAVEVEILAFPGSGASRVVMSSLDVGLPMPQFSQCGPTDDRVPSSDPRSARLLPIGCTGWLIDDCAGCFLTAGHCQGNIGVVQFNVPFSTSTGGLVNPPPSDQYAFDASSLQGNGGSGTGDDWAYFGAFANSTTGLTPMQAQGTGFVLAMPPPAGGGNEIRITGFGTDQSPPSFNQTQQTHVGPFVTNNGTLVQYRTDTTGGNSGSPVIWEQTGEAVGIHTHGGCNTSGTGQNSGTGMSHPGLQAALASPLGLCSGGILPQMLPDVLAPGQPALVSALMSGPFVPGTATLHWRSAPGQLFNSVAMTPVSGAVFGASLPAFACSDAPEFYFSAQFTTCGALTAPPAGAAAPYSAAVGVEVATFQDDFETSLGWTTAVAAATGAWDRGVPVNDPGWAYDPSSDGDGSGSCFLTQNTFGNSDVDNGNVTLVSPLLDLAGGGFELGFYYFLELTNTNGDDALTVDVSDDGGSTWRQLRRFTDETGLDWLSETITAAELLAAGVAPSSQTRVRFIANDSGTQSIVEAGVDGVEARSVTCDPTLIGVNYCTANVNSTGSAARILAQGSALVASNDVTLTAEAMPANALGYFVTGRVQAFIPNAGGSSGNLCLGNPIGRYAGNVMNAGAGGTFGLVLDLAAVPQPSGPVAVVAGETWNFQAWFRDSLAGIPTSNFTNGVSIAFN